MPGVKEPISFEQFNDLIGRPVLDANGRPAGHLSFHKATKEKDPFMKLYQTGATTALARDRRANATTLRVFLALLENMGYENHIAISQRKLSEELDIHRANIAKALKDLTTLGVIERGEKDETLNTYRLSRSYGWKGDPPKGRHQ